MEGGGVPPFSVNFFPLTFRKNLVRGGPGGGGGYPPNGKFPCLGFLNPSLSPKQLFLGGFPYANVAKPVDRLTSFILIKPTMLIPSCALLAQIVNIMLGAFYFLSVIVYTQKQ